MAKDYNAIARQRITRPADSYRHPRMLIYARNKKGKTRFGMSAGVDNILILDPERGTDPFKKLNPHVWHIEKYQDIDDAYNFLKYGKHEYKFVQVDGLTRLANMSLKYTMKLQEAKSLDRIPGLVQQRDYGKSGELVKTMMQQFHTLNMGVIFTAQERMEEAQDSEEDEEIEGGHAMFVPDLPKGVRGFANSIVDVIGRLYIVKDEGVVKRRLWLGESLKYDTGYRSDFVLPDYLENPTVPKLVRLLRTGSEVAPKTPAKK